MCLFSEYQRFPFDVWSVECNQMCKRSRCVCVYTSVSRKLLLVRMRFHVYANIWMFIDQYLYSFVHLLIYIPIVTRIRINNRIHIKSVFHFGALIIRQYLNVIVLVQIRCKPPYYLANRFCPVLLSDDVEAVELVFRAFA